ncbi:MAG: ATP-binding protein [Acidimicrobiales bacterium]
MTPPGRIGALPAHQVTTRHLGAAYPLLAEGGLGHRGVLVGRDLLGGSFVYDPFELYAAGIVSNPNMIVLGQIGRGKSAFVKTYLWRQAVFGRRAWVVDPKGEYAPLAAAWGMRPVTLRPGGSVRLNPLDPAPDGPGLPTADGDSGAAAAPGPEGALRPDDRRAGLLASLAAACLGRPVQPRERAAADLALATACARHGVPTLPAVVDALLAPTAEAARSIRTDRASLLEDGRDVALELRRLVHGDLRGMFDGPTSGGLDLGAPLVVLDLSALYDSPALGILMACATAWLQAALARQAASPAGATRRHVLVVVDEAWAVLANLGVARWLQASWKLSRAYGVANVAVLHRLSDLRSVGTTGSEQVGLASGLLADSETRVVYAQPPGEVAAAGELLSLSPTEADLLPQLRRGVALWKVGRRSFLVQHLLGPAERGLVDTDAAMVSS